MSRERKQVVPAFIDLAAQRERLGDSVERAISAVLNHGQFVLGPEVTELERQLAAFCGARHCVSCANGTDALLLALMAEGIGAGDAVFVPAFTFVATVEVAVLAGATPVFVDVRPDSFNLDVESLEAAIGEAKKRGLKPRCVIPVDLYGQPADYDGDKRNRRGAWAAGDWRRGAELRREPRRQEGRHAGGLYRDQLLSVEAAWRLWRRRRGVHR